MGEQVKTGDPPGLQYTAQNIHSWSYTGQNLRSKMTLHVTKAETINP